MPPKQYKSPTTKASAPSMKPMDFYCVGLNKIINVRKQDIKSLHKTPRGVHYVKAKCPKSGYTLVKFIKDADVAFFRKCISPSLKPRKTKSPLRSKRKSKSKSKSKRR